MIKVLYFGNILSKHGYTPTTIENLSRLLQEEDMDIRISSDKRNKLLRFFDMIIFFLKHRKGTDVVLIDTYSTLNFWYAVVIGRLSYHYNIKYIPILHGGKLPRRVDRNRKIADKLFGRSAVNVAPSTYLYTEFLERGFHNMVVIPNFINERDYVIKLREKMNPIKMLWVRSFSNGYNPQMAIRCLHKLREEIGDATLLMIGGTNGGDACFNETKQLAQDLEVADAVEFTGKLSKKDLIKRSEECNVFINTTNADNTPVSVIEAMAVGIPVVSTNVGGIPYLIRDGENGLLVEVGNIEEMVGKLKLLYEDDSLVLRLSRASVETGMNYYSANVKNAWRKLLIEELMCKK